MTWTLTAVPGETEVSVHCENAPQGIRPEDHETGFRSTPEYLNRVAAMMKVPASRSMKRRGVPVMNHPRVGAARTLTQSG